MKTTKLFRLVALLALLLPAIGSLAQSRDHRLTIRVSTAAQVDFTGQVVQLTQSDYSVGYGTLRLNADGEVTVKVYPGNHLVRVEREGFITAEKAFSVDADMTVDITLAEKVKAPFALATQVSHNALTGLNDVLLTWNREAPVFFDDFEQYSPFAISFGEWTGIDGDGLASAPLVGDYPNRGALQYATVVNPMAVEPSWWYDYPVLRPYSGKQYAGFVRTASGNANNDWLISPTITPGTDNVLQFMAKAADLYDEKFQVYVTTVTDKPAASDFVKISAGNYLSVDYKWWHKQSFDLSAYAGTPIKFAIRYIGEANIGGAFMLMVDDVYVGQDIPEAAEAVAAAKARARRIAKPRSVTNPNESFTVYFNEAEAGTTEALEYLFTDVAAGTHTLGVKSVYLSSESEVVTTTVDISASEYARVECNVVTNNGKSADGATVEFTNLETLASFTAVVADGKAVLPSLPFGRYSVGMAVEHYEVHEQTVEITADAVLSISLVEELVTPYNITTDIAEDGSVMVKWNQQLAFRDNFESYPDFAQTEFGGWKSVDFDERPVYPIGLGGYNNIVTFPGASTPDNLKPIAPIVFNPWATTPPMMPSDPASGAVSGNKQIVFFSPQQSGADKWLISPTIHVYDNFVVRFVTKAYADYAETLDVLATTADDVNSLTTSMAMQDAFTSLGTIERVPSGQWTIYEVPLTAFVGEDVRVAFHYTSWDAFFLQLDDFFAGVPDAEGNAIDVGDVLRYEIWLDGTKVGESSSAEFRLTGVAPGEHTVGVVAVYASGSSVAGTYTFTTSSGVGFIRLNDPAGSGPAEYYNVAGQRLLSAPTRGIFIEKRGATATLRTR